MSCKSLKESLLKCINKSLKAVDDVGANIHEVCVVERCWSGDHIGDGKYRERVDPILPTPGLKDFSHDIRAVEGGGIQQGDILLTRISKANYTREFLAPQQEHPNIEKFMLIDGREYRVVNIRERLVTFDVLVRQTISKRRPVRP